MSYLYNVVKISDKGVANGVASLDANGDIPAGQLDNGFWVVVTNATELEAAIATQEQNIFLRNGNYNLTQTIVPYNGLNLIGESYPTSFDATDGVRLILGDGTNAAHCIFFDGTEVLDVAQMDSTAGFPTPGDTTCQLNTTVVYSIGDIFTIGADESNNWYGVPYTMQVDATSNILDMKQHTVEELFYYDYVHRYMTYLKDVTVKNIQFRNGDNGGNTSYGFAVFGGKNIHCENLGMDYSDNSSASDTQIVVEYRAVLDGSIRGVRANRTYGHGLHCQASRDILVEGAGPEFVPNDEADVAEFRGGAFLTAKNMYDGRLGCQWAYHVFFDNCMTDDRFSISGENIIMRNIMSTVGGNTINIGETGGGSYALTRSKNINIENIYSANSMSIGTVENLNMKNITFESDAFCSFDMGSAGLGCKNISIENVYFKGAVPYFVEVGTSNDATNVTLTNFNSDSTVELTIGSSSDIPYNITVENYNMPTNSSIDLRNGNRVNFKNVLIYGDFDISVGANSGNANYVTLENINSVNGGYNIGVEEGSTLSNGIFNNCFSDNGFVITSGLSLSFQNDGGITSIASPSIVNLVGASAAEQSLSNAETTISLKTCTVFINDTTSASTVTIPTDRLYVKNLLVIKDVAGNASTYNKTIATEGSETIDGAATAVINQNYGSVTLRSNGSGWFIV